MKKIVAMMMVVMVASAALALEWHKACKYIQKDEAGASFSLQDDGHGVYIKTWVSTNAKPTVAELEAVEADAIAWYDGEANDKTADYTSWSNVELKIAIKLLVKEINILRVEAGLPARTAAQVKAALKAELE